MERSTYAPIPHKFEAGTPPIVEAVGLGAALDYLAHIGMERIQRTSRPSRRTPWKVWPTVPGVKCHGAARRRRPRRRDLVRARGRPPARRGDRARHPWRRGAGRSPLREAGARSVRRASRRRGCRRTSTPRPARSTRWWRVCTTPATTSRCGEQMTESSTRCTRRSSWTTTAPHHRGLREPFEAEVHHVNPTCGDEVTLRVHLDRGETRRRRVLRRRGLLDLAGRRLGDD